MKNMECCFSFIMTKKKKKKKNTKETKSYQTEKASHSVKAYKLVFSDVWLIHFFHISGMAFTSCNQQNWSLF